MRTHFQMVLGATSLSSPPSRQPHRATKVLVLRLPRPREHRQHDNNSSHTSGRGTEPVYLDQNRAPSYDRSLASIFGDGRTCITTSLAFITAYFGQITAFWSCGSHHRRGTAGFFEALSASFALARLSFLDLCGVVYNEMGGGGVESILYLSFVVFFFLSILHNDDHGW